MIRPIEQKVKCCTLCGSVDPAALVRRRISVGARAAVILDCLWCDIRRGMGIDDAIEALDRGARAALAEVA